jgi:hypothetical protein
LGSSSPKRSVPPIALRLLPPWPPHVPLPRTDVNPCAESNKDSIGEDSLHRYSGCVNTSVSPSGCKIAAALLFPNAVTCKARWQMHDLDHFGTHILGKDAHGSTHSEVCRPVQILDEWRPRKQLAMRRRVPPALRIPWYQRIRCLSGDEVVVIAKHVVGSVVSENIGWCVHR